MKYVLIILVLGVALLGGAWYMGYLPLSKHTPDEKFGDNSFIETTRAQLEDVTEFIPVNGVQYGDATGSAQAGFDGSRYSLLITAFGLNDVSAPYMYNIVLVKRSDGISEEERHSIPAEFETVTVESDDRGSRHMMLYTSDVNYMDYDLIFLTSKSLLDSTGQEPIILQGEFE